jgi:hypothetical protein
MRLSGFLIQDKTFRILIQDKNLTECTEKKKAHTKTARVFAVKNKIWKNRQLEKSIMTLSEL